MKFKFPKGPSGKLRGMLIYAKYETPIVVMVATRRKERYPNRHKKQSIQSNPSSTT